MKTQKELKPLIDADILRYRCGFAADAQIRRDLAEKYPEASKEEIEKMMQNVEYTAIALHNVDTVINKVLEEFSPEYKVFIQGEGNFRESIATLKPYKGNRDADHKPKYFKEIKEHLLTKWHAIQVAGVETDDAIAMEQFDNPDKYTVIVSTDKDMDCVPGWHYNWVQERLYYVSIKDANLFVFWQMLVGDTADNIPGINKIGPKRADALIESCDRDIDRVREEVKKLYQKQYGDTWQNAYWEVGNLLYLRRYPGEKECPLL